MKKDKKIKINLRVEGIDPDIWKIISVQGDTQHPDHYIVEIEKKENDFEN